MMSPQLFEAKLELWKTQHALEQIPWPHMDYAARVEAELWALVVRWHARGVSKPLRVLLRALEKHPAPASPLYRECQKAAQKLFQTLEAAKAPDPTTAHRAKQLLRSRGFKV